jgi:hypothetical protein
VRLLKWHSDTSTTEVNVSSGHNTGADVQFLSSAAGEAVFEGFGQLLERV